MPRMSIEKLQRAGFSLENFEDGRFWVYEREAGVDSARLLAICRCCVTNFEEYSLRDIFILQCDVDFKNPVLYLDGSLWQLSPRDFAGVVRRVAALGKGGKIPRPSSIPRL